MLGAVKIVVENIVGSGSVLPWIIRGSILPMGFAEWSRSLLASKMNEIT